jgi:hypothetical protein
MEQAVYDEVEQEEFIEEGLERNIAQLSRNGGSFYSDNEGLGTIDQSTLEAIKLIYTSLRITLETRKGEWQIYARAGDNVVPFLEREKPEIGHNFIAVYYRDGDARTMFSGEYDEITEIKTVAKELSDKVLEQRKLFAWPPKKLIEEFGNFYGFKKGGMGFLSSILLESAIGQLTKYESLHEKWANYCQSSGIDEGIMISIVVSGVILGATISSAIGTRVGEYLGRVADEYRQKNLPEKYKYGREVEDAVWKEYSEMKEQTALSLAYEIFRRDTGKEPERETFAEIYKLGKPMSMTKESIIVARRVIDRDDSLDANDVLTIFELAKQTYSS